MTPDTQAQEFGQANVDELAAALQESSNNILISSVTVTVATKFSPASSSSTQAKLLRVLKTIEYMYTLKTFSTANNTRSDDVEKWRVKGNRGICSGTENEEAKKMTCKLVAAENNIYLRHRLMASVNSFRSRKPTPGPGQLGRQP